MRAVANSSTTRITGLVSGHPEKAARFADMYGVPRSSIYNYEDFDRIRENKDIDATYIGLPNSMHKEFTIRSAQAGKHVLCEKPMAISSAECREMIAGCRKANVKLMIAYRIHYDPTHRKAVDLIKQGRIGEIQFCEGNFGSYFQANQWRLTRAMGGGGPLMDMGIYPLNTIRFYTGIEPVRFAALTSTMDRQSGRFKDIEESLSWTMEMSSGVLANCATSYTTRLPGYIKVIGSRGTCRSLPPTATRDCIWMLIWTIPMEGPARTFMKTRPARCRSSFRWRPRISPSASCRTRNRGLPARRA